MTSLVDICKYFRFNGRVAFIEPFGSGHINSTFRVFVEGFSEPKFILQRINTHVFPDVAALSSNINRVIQHLSIKSNEFEMMQPVLSINGNSWVTNDKGEIWRMFTYIPNSVSVDLVTHQKQAEQAGRAYGWFIDALSDLNYYEIHEVIPKFQCLESRFKQLKQAVDFNFAQRLNDCTLEVDFYLSRYSDLAEFYRKIGSADIPIRVTHNDTKVNNILFTSDWKAKSIIDLDTVMPGVVHFDFGDSVRTICALAVEDDLDITKVGINIDLFDAFSKGFLGILSQKLTNQEIDSLWLAPKYMTFIMGIRFLADYLRGDDYYKIKYPEHNLHRAQNQMALVMDMEGKSDQIKLIIKKHSQKKG